MTSLHLAMPGGHRWYPPSGARYLAKGTDKQSLLKSDLIQETQPAGGIQHLYDRQTNQNPQKHTHWRWFKKDCQAVHGTLPWVLFPSPGVWIWARNKHVPVGNTYHLRHGLGWTTFGWCPGWFSCQFSVTLWGPSYGWHSDNLKLDGFG
jgi:hypothetical protein